MDSQEPRSVLPFFSRFFPRITMFRPSPKYHKPPLDSPSEILTSPFQPLLSTSRQNSPKCPTTPSECVCFCHGPAATHAELPFDVSMERTVGNAAETLSIHVRHVVASFARRFACRIARCTANFSLVAHPSLPHSSPFVYSGAMVIWLRPSLDRASAGYYAGLVASSFMFGRTLSSYQWGKWR